MKIIFLIQLLLFCLVTVAQAEEKPVFACSVNGRAISVFMSVQQFDVAKHKIVHKKGSYGLKTLFVDGHEPIGSDNLMPERTWRRFTVFWDGVEVPIPVSLYENFYHPNVDENSIRNRILSFALDPKGEWVQVIMNGSDGAGAYLVGWELRRDGKHVMIDPTKLHQKN